MNTEFEGCVYVGKATGKKGCKFVPRQKGSVKNHECELFV